MLRHLVRQGLPWPDTNCALPEINCRRAAPECPGNCLHRKQAVPAKRSLPYSWVILCG